MKKLTNFWSFAVSALLALAIFLGITSIASAVKTLQVKIVQTISLPNHTLSAGESWILGAGYVFKANSIDVRANPKQVWTTLKKDGMTLDNEVLEQGDVYNYNNIFRATAYSIFAGASTDMVQFREVSVGGEIATYCSNWTCEEWSFCVGNVQVRRCDNACNLTSGGPSESQSCSERRTITLAVGDIWLIWGDYTIEARSIDARGNPRMVWLTFSDRGHELRNKMMSEGECITITDPTRDRSYRIKIDSIFAGMSSDMVRISDANENLSPSCPSSRTFFPAIISDTSSTNISDIIDITNITETAETDSTTDTSDTIFPDLLPIFTPILTPILEIDTSTEIDTDADTDTETDTETSAGTDTRVGTRTETNSLPSSPSSPSLPTSPTSQLSTGTLSESSNSESQINKNDEIAGATDNGGQVEEVVETKDKDNVSAGEITSNKTSFWTRLWISLKKIFIKIF